MKDELGVEVLIKIIGLRGETYSYLTDDGKKVKWKKQKAEKSVP